MSYHVDKFIIKIQKKRAGPSVRPAGQFFSR